MLVTPYLNIQMTKTTICTVNKDWVKDGLSGEFKKLSEWNYVSESQHITGAGGQQAAESGGGLW